MLHEAVSILLQRMDENPRQKDSRSQPHESCDSRGARDGQRRLRDIRYYPFILLRYGERGRFASLRTTHGLDVCLMGKERVERDGPLAVGKPVA